MKRICVNRGGGLKKHLPSRSRSAVALTCTRLQAFYVPDGAPTRSFESIPWGMQYHVIVIRDVLVIRGVLVVVVFVVVVIVVVVFIIIFIGLATDRSKKYMKTI